MKNKLLQTTIIIALMLTSVSALAQEATQQDTQGRSELVETCLEMGLMAEAIFDARQRGASLAQMLGTVDRSAPQDIQNLISEIIIYIYDQPRLRSPGNIAQQRIDVRNEIEMVCITEL